MPDYPTIGPVEIVVIAFPEPNFTGELAPAISQIAASGIVSVIDLVFVAKDEAGDVVAMELNDLDEDVAAAYLAIDGEAGGLLNDDDFAAIGEALEPGSAALAVVWENTWARGFVDAVVNAGGVLVAHDRIDAATANEMMAALAGEE